MYSVNPKKQRKYIDSYNTEEKKMIDVHTINKKKKKQRKYIDSYVHAVNKKSKESKKNKTKSQSTNHFNSLSHLVCGNGIAEIEERDIIKKYLYEKKYPIRIDSSTMTLQRFFSVFVALQRFFQFFFCCRNRGERDKKKYAYKKKYPIRID